MTNNDFAKKYTSRGWSVIPIKPKEKTPDLKSWKEYQERKPTEEELERWFNNGQEHNIAVVCGDISGVVVLDFDTQEGFEKALEELPQTLTCKTAKGGHFYFKAPAATRTTKPGAGIDLKANGGYVLAPPSIHPTGIPYIWLDENTPIADFPEQYLEKPKQDDSTPTASSSTQAPLDKMLAEKKFNELWHSEAGYASTSEAELALCCKLVFYGYDDFHSLDRMIRGSRMAEKWLDVKTPDQYKRLTFEKALSLVRERWTPAQPKHEEKREDTIEFMSGQDLLEKNFEARRWVVKNLMPLGVSFIIAKRNVGKTWFALYLAAAVVEGKPLFEQFEVSQAPVLFIDSENGQQTIQERLKLLPGCEKVQFAFYPNIEIDKQTGINKLDAILSAHPNAVVIVDTLRRVFSADENEAGEVNKILTALKALAEKHHAAFVLLHHFRKGNKDGQVERDLLDEVRGSSDLVNIADSVLCLESPPKSKTVVLRHAKSRVGRLIDPIRFEVVSTDESFSLNYVGTFEEVENRPELVAKEIKQWMFENNLKEFKTGDAVLAMKQRGYYQKVVSRALQSLKTNGDLAQKKKGVWLVPKTLGEFDGTEGTEGTKDACPIV